MSGLKAVVADPESQEWRSLIEIAYVIEDRVEELIEVHTDVEEARAVGRRPLALLTASGVSRSVTEEAEKTAALAGLLGSALRCVGASPHIVADPMASEWRCVLLSAEIVADRLRDFQDLLKAEALVVSSSTARAA